jgi:hypothetical protein
MREDLLEDVLHPAAYYLVIIDDENLQSLIPFTW